MIFKILHVVLLASVKYILTIPYAILIGLNYYQVLLAVLVGGLGGFLFFYYLSGWVIKKLRLVRPSVCRIIPESIKTRYGLFCHQKRQKVSKRIFTKRSRLVVKIKANYGLWGIIITTPILLTIPLGAFLINKYYPRKKYAVTYMLISITGWALILTSLIQVFPGVIK